MDTYGNLTPMQPSDYEVEAVLQALLARYPELLSVESSGGEGPTRWLLVAREAGIPDDSGGNRFALDHLFLDAEGVPTLVEVKRASDSRIRRELVGQMLDYASHFVIHWTDERIRAEYERTCAEIGIEPGERLTTFLGAETGPETFWQRVKTNITARRIRLIFVADHIPLELRRVVEFLNLVTDPVEVLAIEVPQYTGAGMKTFVPRLIGQTVAAQEKKSGSDAPKRKWDEASFLETLEARDEPVALGIARRLLAWALERKLRIWWGEGRNLGSFLPMVDINDEKNFTFAVWTYGSVEFQFQWMAQRRAFGEEARRRMLLDKLNQVPGVAIPADALDRRPSIKLAALAAPASLDAFLAVWDWYVEEVRKTG